MKTTLNKIRQHDPCARSWAKLLASLDKTEADDTEVSILYILDLLGMADALWALRAVDGHDREIRLLACDFAEHVLPIFEAAYPEDKRPRTAIQVARRFADGAATPEELTSARAAAWDAAWDAAMDAAWDAARDAAGGAARDAAWDAAWDAERQWQTDLMRKVLNEMEAAK